MYYDMISRYNNNFWELSDHSSFANYGLRKPMYDLHHTLRLNILLLLF
jgi:hypothetical protein